MRKLFIFDQSSKLFIVWIIKKVNIFWQHKLGWKNNLVKFAPEKWQCTMALVEHCVGRNRVDDDVVRLFLAVESNGFVGDVEFRDFRRQQNSRRFS